MFNKIITMIRKWYSKKYFKEGFEIGVEPLASIEDGRQPKNKTIKP